MSVLSDVHRSDAFARVRTFDECARFHVWHSRLGLAQQPDRGAQEAIRAGRGFAAVGPSGSGKTSTLAAAINSTEGFELAHLPLKLSVAGAEADRTRDPRFLAGRLVRAVAQLSQEAERLLEDATSETSVSTAAATWRTQLGPRAANVARDARQRTLNVTFERTPEEVVNVAAAAVALLRDAGLRPVLLMEDADGLLRLPGKDPEERYAIADAFFLDGLDALIRELAIPALVAVQPDYLALEGFRRVAAHFDGVVSVPAPPELPADSLELLLGETLRASTAPHELSDVFDAEALAILAHNRFSLTTMREVIEISAASIVKARTERHDRILPDDVGYALSQR